MDIDVKHLKIDLMSASGHKIYGPKGIGFLYVKNGVELEPLFYGGSHEHNKRAGTESLYNILGFRVAYELMQKNFEKESNMFLKYRNVFLQGLKNRIDDFVINSPEKDCLQSVINLSFPGVDSETLLLELDSYGISVSAGSACSAKSIKVSRVLSSCGLTDEVAASSMRLSFGRFTTLDDIDFAVDKITHTVEKLRDMNPEYGHKMRNE